MMVGLLAALAACKPFLWVGDAPGSCFPNLGTVPSSQLQDVGFICVASNARRQLGLGDLAGRQLMDLGSSSCPRYHT